MVRQFVIQFENRPGELAHLARALAARGVDIQNISCAGAGPLAAVFITTSDPQVTRDVLRGFGHEFVEGEPLRVEVEDRPGGLAEVTCRLADAGVNILGVVCIGRRPGVVEMAFAVDDELKAREALRISDLAPVR